ncbi:MAG: DUF427 domain-containing protein [Marinibacterium sp.]
MADHIKLRKVAGKWSIRSGGAVLGESGDVLEMTEGDYPPVYYFPRADIAMAFFEKTDKITQCPHKGEASHFSIINRSATIENGAWSYEDPVDEMAGIKGRIAFYPHDDVQVEQI